jgi:hypothetical protein
MEQEKKSIMVTWDFSAVSYNALRHAIKLAHILKNNIVLFHIVNDPADEEPARKKMDGIVEEIKKDYGEDVGCIMFNMVRYSKRLQNTPPKRSTM